MKNILWVLLVIVLLSANAFAAENNNSEFNTLQQYHYNTDGENLHISQNEVATNYLINNQSASSKEELFTAKYGENWQVSTDKNSILPNRMIGGSIELLPSDQENDQFSSTSSIQTEHITEYLVRNFIVENEQIFGLDPSEIELVKEDYDISLYEKKDGISNIVYQQSYEGIPVYSSRVGITVNDGKVVAVDSNIFQDITAPTKPTISEVEALSIIGNDLGIEVRGPSKPLSSISLCEMSGKSTPQTKTTKTKDISLVIYPVETEDANKYYLVYMVDLSTIKEPLSSWTYFVDANTGNILHKYDKIISYDIEGNVTGKIYQEYTLQTPVDVAFWNQTISLINGDPNKTLYSGKGDNLENSAIIVEPIDLTGAVNSKLNFSTKYEIESGYDYAYVIISEDGNNFTNVVNYTGYQTSWADESIDISDWDGKQVCVGFLYDTDLYVSGNGFYADNITVTSDSGIVFSDNFDDSNGNWNLSGFELQPDILSYPLTTTDKNGYYNITNLSENASIYSELSGPYVKVVNEDQQDVSIEFDLTAPIYDWNWGDIDTSDRREESNVFYHVNVIHDYFTKGSPFDIHSMDYQTIATVEYGSESGNAQSDGTNIYFFRGDDNYESTALLSDVIYHEYTHSVVAHVYTTDLPYMDESGALNEGWADYFACTVNNNPSVGEGFYIGNTEGLRNLNDDNRYPSDIRGEVHYDSRIVSAAMWDMRETLGAELADELIIRAMKLEPQNFQEYLEAILIVDDDNGDLSDGTPHINEIIQAFYVNHGIYTPVLFDTLSEHLISNGQIVEEMNELRSPVFSGTDLDDIIGLQDTDFLELSTENFPGFYYDIDNNISTETLRIYGGSFVSDRTIGEGGIVYTTTIQEVEFMGYSNEYPLLILFGEECVPLNYTPDKLARLLVDNDDAYTLRAGQSLELQEEYAITPKEIDVDGKKVWLELTKNGTFVDDTIINASFSEPASDRTWYCMQDLSGEEDIVTLMINVGAVYGQDDPCVILGDIWQISDQVTEINVGDKYGQMVVSSVNDTALTMELDDDIVLDAGSTNNLMDNFEFRVADDPSLRFYLKKKPTESGIYEVRGTVIDSPFSDKTYTWNANSFAGFWYDIDNNATSEVLTVHGVDNMDRGLDADLGELIYNTTIVPGIQPEFDFKAEYDPLMDWTYEKIGFLGEEYVPVSGTSILTKLIIDDNSSNMMGVGDSLNLGEGYAVTSKAIDVDAELVWLELTRNGTVVDDTVINASTNATTSDKTLYYEQDILNESDILTLMIHVNEVNQSGNFIMIDGIWQISDNVIEINVDDEFDRLFVSSVDEQTITMELSGYLYLQSGKRLYLTEDIGLRTADNSSNLRFYPFTESIYVKVAPIATINSISPNPAIEGELVTFMGSGTDSDGPIIGYNWTSNLDGMLSTSANFSTSNLSIGTHTIYFSVKDDDGAWSDTDSATLTAIDGLAPEVHISADISEYISTHNPVTINLNSTDAHLASTNLIIADSEGLEVINQSIDKDEPTGSAFEYVWNATNLTGYSVPSGTYFLYVNSTDTFANFASANVSIVVDNEKPTVVFSEIGGFTSDSNYVYASSDLLINTSASGTPGEVDSVEYTLNSVSTNYKKSIDAELIDGNWTATFDLSLIPDDGKYALTATAIDAARNSNSTVCEKLIIVDHTSPVFSSTASRYNDTHGKVSVISSETITGYPTVEVNSDEIGVNQNIGNWTGYFELDAEEFNVTITGTDIAGNIGSGSSTTFIETIEFTNGTGIFNSSEFGTTITFNTKNNTIGSIIVTESKEPMANLTDDSLGLYFIDVELDSDLTENMSDAMIAIPISSVSLPDGITKEDISIRYYNETEELWETYSTSIESIDGEECWVTHVNHFSIYGVVVTDTLAPVKNSVTPLSGTTFNKNTTSVDIRFNYTDEQTGINVSSIAFEFNDTLITDDSLEITGSYASYTATGLSSGSHTASVTVTDNAGNSALFSTSFSIASDTTPTNNPKSSSSSSGSGGGGSGATGEAFENIMFKEVKTENILGGLEISYTFYDEQNAIEYINFSALRNYGRVSTTVEVLKDISAMVDDSAPGLVYSNLNIWVGKSGFATEDNIADPVIGFSVAKEWLKENGIDENSIALYRHSEGKWNTLKTMKVGEDDSYIYFEAETPGFSPFAIAADVDDKTLIDNTVSEEEVPKSEDDTKSFEEEFPVTESNGIPGFSLLTSVCILVFACLFRKRKN